MSRVPAFLLPPLLLLLNGRGAFTAARSLNAPRHGLTDGTDGQRTAAVSGNVPRPFTGRRMTGGSVIRAQSWVETFGRSKS